MKLSEEEEFISNIIIKKFSTNQFFEQIEFLTTSLKKIFS
jgi:hypothetical protein